MSRQPQGYLTRDELLALDDLTAEDIEIPEWGGRKVRVRALTKGEQLDIRARATVGGEVDVGLVELLAVQAALVEPRLTPDDIGVLRARNAAAINRITTKVAQLAGLSEEASAEATRRFRS